ncbi:Protein of unknown function [Pyronema omphalodes CBS 100304]|uniref:Uncharacterized protein n=1 Tax=Pyronema omphalodes (strain CBS 100304) TaxID=1076935 RepID=U4L7I5_PYROM|nr:Protein of unknown function [Pyronema omphalodes CBS 100304]
MIDGYNPQPHGYNTYLLAKGYSRIITKDGLVDVRYTQPMPDQFIPVAAGGPSVGTQPHQQLQAQTQARAPAQTQTQNYHQTPILVSIRNPYEGLSKDEAAKLTAWQAQNPHLRVVGNPKDLNGKIENLVNWKIDEASDGGEIDGAKTCDVATSSDDDSGSTASTKAVTSERPVKRAVRIDDRANSKRREAGRVVDTEDSSEDTSDDSSEDCSGDRSEDSSNYSSDYSSEENRGRKSRLRRKTKGNDRYRGEGVRDRDHDKSHQSWGQHWVRERSHERSHNMSQNWREGGSNDRSRIRSKDDYEHRHQSQQNNQRGSSGIGNLCNGKKVGRLDSMECIDIPVRGVFDAVCTRLRDKRDRRVCLFNQLGREQVSRWKEVVIDIRKNKPHRQTVREEPRHENRPTREDPSRRPQGTREPSVESIRRKDDPQQKEVKQRHPIREVSPEGSRRKARETYATLPQPETRRREAQRQKDQLIMGHETRKWSEENFDEKTPRKLRKEPPSREEYPSKSYRVKTTPGFFSRAWRRVTVTRGDLE